MKAIKKTLAIITAAAMLCTLPAGCGESKKAQSGNGDVNLTWYFIGNSSQEGNDEVYQKASEMVKEKLGFSVSFIPIDEAAYQQKMQMIISGGEDYDICWTSNWLNDYVTNVYNGAFLPLDDLLEDTPDLKNSMIDAIWSGTRIGGKIYGVPNQQIMARSAAIRVPEVFYEKYGDTLRNVKSYTDMTDYMAAVAKDYPQTAQVQLCWENLSNAYGVDEILGSERVSAVSFNGDKNDIKVFNQFDTDEWRELIKVRNSWAEKGYTIKAVNGSGNSDKKTKPEQEPFAVECYKPGAEVEIEQNLTYPVKLIRISPSYLGSKGINATLNAINKKSKHPKEALKFIEYVNMNPDIMNLLVYGIEGKHYIKMDDKTVKRVENTKFSNNSWVMGNVFNTYVQVGMNPNNWEETKEMNNTAATSKLLGFSVDLDPIKLQVANCNSAVTEYIGRLSNGTGDSQALNQEMLGKLKIAGVDDVISELQRQIDNWLAKK